MKSKESAAKTYPEYFAWQLFWIGIIVHLMFLLSLSAGFLNPFFDDATHRVGQGSDFYAVYQAGQNVIDGVSIYLQNPPTLVVPYFYVYRYLPFTAYTFGQFFRIFQPEVAYVVWIFINEILLIFNLILTRRIFHQQSHAQVAMSLWLFFSPYYLELYMGQFSFFMATLCFWMINYWMIKKEKLGDILWSLSLLVKSNFVLFAPVLLKMRRWKSILVAVVIVVAFSVPYFYLIPGTFESFAWNFTEGLSVETIAGNQGFSALIAVGVLRIGGHWVQNVNQFFQEIEKMNAAIQIPLLVWIGVIGVTTLLVIIKSSQQYVNELFILCILTYFLIYKHVWEHHYVMLLPVFIFLYHNFMEKKKGIMVSKKLFWWVYVVVALPTPFIFIDKMNVMIDPEFYWSSVESIAFHIAKPTAVFVLYVVLSLTLFKLSRHGGSSEGIERISGKAPKVA